METQSAIPGPNAAGRHRLFFALVPDEALRSRFSEAASSLRDQFGATGSWTNPARYHLTLRFLGEAPELRQPLLEAAVRAASQVSLPAFDLVLDRAASFPGSRPPWVLLCREPATGVRALAQALADIGDRRIRAEQDFVPHLTVLRHADQALPEQAIGAIRWPVAEFQLLHSRPGQDHAYEELGRWRLRRG